eukprot:4929538-Prymnesium_polylepis.1
MCTLWHVRRIGHERAELARDDRRAQRHARLAPQRVRELHLTHEDTPNHQVGPDWRDILHAVCERSTHLHVVFVAVHEIGQHVVPLTLLPGALLFRHHRLFIVPHQRRRVFPQFKAGDCGRLCAIVNQAAHQRLVLAQERCLECPPFHLADEASRVVVLVVPSVVATFFGPLEAHQHLLLSLFAGR